MIDIPCFVVVLDIEEYKEAQVSDRWLSVEEIAEHLGVSKDTVYTWVKEKNMPAHKVGKLWKFQIREVDRWVKSGKATPP